MIDRVHAYKIMAGLTGLVAAGTACSPPMSQGLGAQGIVGGGPSPTDEEVFMISFSVLGIPNMCSATLISERTLLTAAHCLDTRYYPGGSRIRFRATNLADARSSPSGSAIDIVDAVIHPTYGVLDGRNDVGLALLASAPLGVPPKPWNRTDSRLLIGAPIRALGYGFTDPEDHWSYGVRSEVELSIRDADDHFLVIGDQESRGFCNGDSGGPSFHLFPDGIERLVGIHSAGETCTDGRDVRVDLFADFIDTWIAEKEAPPLEPEMTLDAGVIDAEGPESREEDVGSLDASPRIEGPPPPGSSEDAGARLPEVNEVRTLREVSSCQAVRASEAFWPLGLGLFAGRKRRRLRAPSRARCG